MTLVGKEGKEKKYYLFVFNDIILCSKQSYARKKVVNSTVKFDVMVITSESLLPTVNIIVNCKKNILVKTILIHLTNLSQSNFQIKFCSISDLTPEELKLPGRNKYCFKLTSAKNGKTYTWKAESSVDKQGWMKSIQSCIDEAKDPELQDLPPPPPSPSVGKRGSVAPSLEILERGLENPQSVPQAPSTPKGKEGTKLIAKN